MADIRAITAAHRGPVPYTVRQQGSGATVRLLQNTAPPLRRVAARLAQRRAFGRGLLGELDGARNHASDTRSLVRLSVDILLYRVLFVFPRVADRPRLRTIRLDGCAITYRLNRGDLQAIREVWLEEAYRVPIGPAPRTVLDLGANIGLTSVWLAARYGCAYVVGVEPDPGNAALARRNLASNGVSGVVIEAATGPVDGTASFAPDPSSVSGAITSDGAAGRSFDVEVMTPQSLMRRAGLASVDLCKLDIEGAEGPLMLSGDPAWLDAVGSMLAELHEQIVDTAAVRAAIEASGLLHNACGTRAEFFARPAWLVQHGENGSPTWRGPH